MPITNENVAILFTSSIFPISYFTFIPELSADRQTSLAASQRLRKEIAKTSLFSSYIMLFAIQKLCNNESIIRCNFFYEQLNLFFHFFLHRPFLCISSHTKQRKSTLWFILRAPVLSFWILILYFLYAAETPSLCHIFSPPINEVRL